MIAIDAIGDGAVALLPSGQLLLASFFLAAFHSLIRRTCLPDCEAVQPQGRQSS